MREIIELIAPVVMIALFFLGMAFSRYVIGY